MNRACLFYMSRFISHKNIDRGARRVRGAILVVAIALVPLVTVVEVSSGMINGITSRYLEIGTFHLQVRFFGHVSRKGVGDLAGIIKRQESVKSATVVYEGVGLAYGASRRLGVTIRAYDPEFIAGDSGFRRYISLHGKMPSESEFTVSSGTAEALDLHIGDTLTLVVARTLQSGRLLLKQHSGTVAGIFSTGYADLDGHAVLISHAAAEHLFPEASGAFIGIKVARPFDSLARVIGDLQGKMPPGAYIYSWRELERGMYVNFQTTRALLIVVMAVIVGVAAITISNALFILVAERETEIALLRSTGAAAFDVRSAFVLLGFAIGVIGTFAGLSIGLFISLRINELFSLIERAGMLLGSTARWLLGSSGASSEPFRILDPSLYLDRIPVEPGIRELLIISAASIGLATLSAAIPARRAGGIVPAESLTRH